VAKAQLPRLFWRVLNAIGYWVTQARLSIVNAVCGPKPGKGGRAAPRSGAAA
jgi:hypothetical protein